jgi:histidine kinase
VPATGLSPHHPGGDEVQRLLNGLRNSLVSKLVFSVGGILLIFVSVWAYFNISDQKRKAMDYLVAGTDRLTNTIRLGTHYAMMTNSRDDINQIIRNIGQQGDIENIRIYNKAGQIKFSNRAPEVDQTTNIKAEACDICHRSDPPRTHLALEKRIRIFDSADGYRLLGIISPIYNEPSCATDACHVHPADKKVLGALDVVVSLKEADAEILASERNLIRLSVFVFLLAASFIIVCVTRFVNRPIRRLIEGTRQIARGNYRQPVAVHQEDEMGQLGRAINQMAMEIGRSNEELNKQRNEYLNLFERAPCTITVQDRDYRLLRYNREFAEKFDPEPGDFCFRVYKGRETKCPECPVEKTFADGQSHVSEETGVDKDGSRKHWLVTTSPIKNERGEIVAAMEMNLDITQRKALEERLDESEKKYHAIFNNIPNPVFVLDVDSLEILDCNDSIAPVYGYRREDMIGKRFSDLFVEEERERYADQIKHRPAINQAKQQAADGRTLFVNILVSPSEHPGRNVLLVTTSDITKRLEAEQQLIQASKMATLGEMSTGVAHELNQPLAVIKTASSFFMKKIGNGEKIDDRILCELSEEIDSHVDRATKIINHMRQFGRKPELTAESVQVNEVLRRAFEFFSQQLKLRGIQVEWDAQEGLPHILADPGKLEQVIINLLINARDAIEERWEEGEVPGAEKKITLKTYAARQEVVIEVCDTGTGIPGEILGKIFEPFFTTKKVGKGTGLGLSISYGIVKDYGGNIRAASNAGEGTCFVISFPIPEKPPGE